MRELHVVGLTPDGQHLLLAGAPDALKGSHRVAVDARFEAALRGQRPHTAPAAPSLSVRDIQARLRGGATIEEVAALAGLPVSRVERFAGPVLSEREEVLRKVRAAHQLSRRGRSATTLARAVPTALETIAHLRPETLSWTAHRNADGVWVASVSVVARGRTRRAQWVLDDSGTVRPLDTWAGQLGHVEEPGLVAPRRAAATQRSAATQPSTVTHGRAVAPKRPAASNGRAAATQRSAATQPSAATNGRAVAAKRPAASNGRAVASRRPAAANPTDAPAEGARRTAR